MKWWDKFKNSRFGITLWAILGYQPFSWGSLILLAGAYWSFRKIGVDELDHILIIVGAVSLFLVGMAVLGTIMGTIYTVVTLRAYRKAKDIRIVESFACQTGFTFSIPWWVPLVQCRWRWLTPDVPIKIERKGERVVFSRRGHWKTIKREFWISDTFGICRVRFTREMEIDLLVEANTGKLAAPVFALGMQDGGESPHPMGKPYGDRVDIRNYAPGDPVRYILWKTYARTGELVVRNPERALKPAERILAYLISSARDSASAGAAQATINSHGLGRDWKFGADGSKSAVEEIQQATDLITRSADVESNQGSDLASFVKGAVDERFHSLVVFAPPETGPWISRVIEQCQRVSVMVVIGIDGFVVRARFSRLKAFAFRADSNPYSSISDYRSIHQIITTLQAANVQVQIADRKSGAIVDAHQFIRVYQ